MGKKITVFFCLIFLIFMSISVLNTALSVNHSNATDTPVPGELNIDVSNQPPIYQTGKTYKLTITLTANTFGPNQTNFNSLYVQLRLLTDVGTFSSEQKGAYEIDTLGATISISLNVVIPSKSQLDISKGQYIRAELEYDVDYKIGLTSGTSPSYSTDWHSLGLSSIETPSGPSNVAIFYLVLFSLIQFDCNAFHQNTITISDISGIEVIQPFCLNCGRRLDLNDSFCSNCGQTINKD